MPENVKLTNQKLGELWNSFDIPQGNFNLQSWVGKVGGAKIKHEMYEGETSPKIAYFISRDRQDNLAPWQEKAASTPITSVMEEMEEVDNLPWEA